MHTWRFPAISGLLLFVWLAAMSGCSGAGGADSDVKKAFGPTTEKTTFVYQRTDDNGATNDFPAGIVGEKTIGGASYPRYQVGYFNEANPEGPEIWAKVDPENKTVTFAGGMIYWKDNGMVPEGEPFLSGETDEAVVFDMEPPVGEEQTITGSGHVTMGDPENPLTESDVDITVTYVLEDNAANVDSNIGRLTDISVFKGSTELEGQSMAAEIWYHQDIGAVYIGVNWPPPDGIAFDLLSTSDYGDGSGDDNTIKALSVIGPNNPNYTLSTYDVNGAFDADKDSHAKMFLEYRWADEAKALTEEEPDVTVSFGTVFGTFPYLVAKSSISIFHPEENGLGYTYWVSYVDEAAKNEAENGISYNIGVTANSGLTDKVRVTGRIYYKLYKP